ncbi:MAG TPA: carboxypeptidase-like regulatory domain-containing protein, partial [Puia sp.]
MKKFPIFLFFVACMQFSTYAQKPAIHGKVIDDSTGAGLPDVSVILSGTTKGTTTGADGSFTLAFPTDGKRHTLEFSHADFGDEVLPATNTGSIFLRMKKKTTQLEDVVVIGYQTVRRRDALASISSIS